VPILDELGLFLQTAGVGSLGTTLFKGSLPLDHPLTDAAPPILAMIEVPGLPVVRAHDSKFEQPVLQVAVKGAPFGYAAARLKAQEAWNVLDGVSNAVLSGVAYLWIEALQSPFWLRTDESNRPLIVFSIRVARAV
jgi:hypothetical protein